VALDLMHSHSAPHVEAALRIFDPYPAFDQMNANFSSHQSDGELGALATAKTITRRAIHWMTELSYLPRGFATDGFGLT